MDLTGLTGALTVTALMSGSGFDVEGWHCREGGHAGKRGNGRESRHGGDSGKWNRGQIGKGFIGLDFDMDVRGSSRCFTKPFLMSWRSSSDIQASCLNWGYMIESE